MILSPKQLMIRPIDKIIEAMKKLNELGKNYSNNTLLVMDEENRLVGTLNDGDIRRALLKGFSMDTSAVEICKKHPIVAPENISELSMIELLKVNKIRILPLVNTEGIVVGVKRLDGKIGESTIDAVIMAGGKGTRLLPLTKNVPKPMLEIGEKPILQIIIELLKNYGVYKINISVNYLSDIIKDYFLDGSDFGVKINYLEESYPMGTAGSLSLLDLKNRPLFPFIVINADLLTTLNFRVFRDFHLAAEYDLTIAGYPYEVHLPFGCPIIEGDIVVDFKEKPTFSHLINSGIYCLAPDIIDRIPENKYTDMPELINSLIRSKKRVGVFPLKEALHEMGSHESYKKAEDFYFSHFGGASKNDDTYLNKDFQSYENARSFNK